MPPAAIDRPPAAPAPQSPWPPHARVINGEFGNGDQRRAALGDLYDAVQARVNEMLS